jgi:hypothetical protein
MLPQDRFTQLTPFWYLRREKLKGASTVYLQLPMNSRLREVVKVCLPFIAQ